MNTFTATSCIKFGWETFKKRSWFFIGATAVAILVYGILLGIVGAAANGSSLLTSLSGLIKLVLEMFLGMGFVALFLKAHDAVDSARISDLWHPHPFWKYTGAALLSGIIIGIGLFLLVVPGIIAILVLMFAEYIVIDRGLGPIAAMKESARITKGHRWELFILFILVVLINILGVICLLVGLLVSTPVTSMAVVHAYRTLSRTSAPAQEAAVA